MILGNERHVESIGQELFSSIKAIKRLSTNHIYKIITHSNSFNIGNELADYMGIMVVGPCDMRFINGTRTAK